MNRISVKFFANGAETLDLSSLVALYHGWIQTSAVPGLLIDAADYKHVPNGPGVILIGHEGDYGFDLSEGRPGLLYTRKRDLPATLTESLRLIFQNALLATQQLTQAQGITFNYAEPKITLIDRLQMPNTPATFEAVKPEIHAFLAALYGVEELSLQAAHPDVRDLFALQATVPLAASVDDLLGRLTPVEVRVT